MYNFFLIGIKIYNDSNKNNGIVRAVCAPDYERMSGCAQSCFQFDGQLSTEGLRLPYPYNHPPAPDPRHNHPNPPQPQHHQVADES